MVKKETVKGYKVFNSDWTCRDFQYKVGKTYEMEETPELCNKGFHFCLKIEDCFKYYDDNLSNKIAEVEALGSITGIKDNCSKIATNKIKIIREISKEESYKIGNTGDRNTGYNNTGNRNTGNRNTGNRNTGYSNTGDRNTGDCNTGNRNTGYSNTGDRNTGDCNTGYNNTGNRNTGYSNTGDRNTGNWNTGNWNTGDWNNCNNETGFFNVEQPKYINVFGKKCKREVWGKVNKPSFLYFSTTKFIQEDSMTDKEKEINIGYKTIGGFLKEYSYKEAFINSFNKTSKQDVELLLELPNFNYKIFEEISGISKKMIKEKLK